ncbi:MAG: class I mannose-6-phosphate isomerase [Sphingomonadales bacterium]|nr:class I mannose-6-phosphate isomerase [Sphingomonadales bacterium]
MNEAGKLAIRMVEKPWGQDRLPPPFAAPPRQRIGEIWFEPQPPLDALLVKYLFTSEALSVQVHPSDDQTRAAGLGPQGKEECWLIVAAEPGARIGIGFNAAIDSGALRRAALDGSIERLLTWHDVAPGDFFYIPANTVHAIGGGVSLIEIQQNSDITYRLYDYGRPRELHLDAGLAVARGQPYDEALHRRLRPDEAATLVDGPFFRLERVAGVPGRGTIDRFAGAPALVVPLDGTVRCGDCAVRPGECGWVAEVAGVDWPAGGASLLAQPLAAS